MIKHWAIRLLTGLVCGLSLAGFTMLVTQFTPVVKAEPATQSALPDDCVECHESVVINLEDSRHGQALNDPAFQAAWQEKGSPNECLACHTTGYDAATHTWEEDGVGCEACHAMEPNSAHHPEQVMPVDRSSESCGQCHVDTHEDWQISKHGQEELSCVRCHNPHTTNLKAESVQEVCIACHNETAYFFAYTAHSQEGMICTDCHLRVSDTPLGEGHGKREHTFAVDLTTCNECHEQEMHVSAPNSGQMGSLSLMSAANNSSEPTVTPCESLETLQSARSHIVYADGGVPTPALTTTEPAPLAYLIPTAFGLLMGVMVSPLLGRYYRRIRVK